MVTQKALTLEYTFSGSFEVPKEFEASQTEESTGKFLEEHREMNAIKCLNSRRGKIAAKAERRIKQLLPEGTVVQVKYHFEPYNSIAFTATVLLIFDWLSPLVISTFEGEVKKRITDGISTIIQETLDFFIPVILKGHSHLSLEPTHIEKGNIEMEEGQQITPYMPDWLRLWRTRERITSALLGIAVLLLASGMFYMFTKDLILIRRDQLPVQEQPSQ